ncbi:MAG: phosphate/phosphite/phosphonate ABC transporter substrate-binding protein [Rhodobacteraceae bacterium]|nr:phosphate/phosphite/phosphonate ABC transporter substrate-binding protein [Paracoccaceae bacterium]
MPRPLFRAVVCLGVIFGASSISTADETPQTLTFGIVPQQSASRLAKMWGPFLAEISTRTGAKIEFRTTKDIPTFEACLAAGAYDIAYMNPMHYTIFSEESGYQAIARQEKKKLRGLLVVRGNSGIDDMTALDGAKIAFPSPGAFGASILNRASLTRMGVGFTPSYVKSHDSVYRAVAAGLLPAGGGVLRTFNSVAPEIREKLQILYKTDAFTPHAIAARDAVPNDMIQAMQTAFLSVAKERPDLVKGIGMKGIELAKDADWDDVRALEMARNDTGISEQSDAACPSD